MKKGIKANLWLPKECLDIIIAKEKEVTAYFDSYPYLEYDIYLGEYDNNEVCAIEVKLLNETCREVNADYSCFKKYLKELTHKQPKQILMYKFDRV